MRIPNEPEEGPGGPFSQLLQLQTDFYTRLTQETLRYLRRLQGAAAPAVPGTVIMPGAEIQLKASGSPGDVAELELEVENRQRVHCVVTPMLSSMVDVSGVTWFPAAETLPPSLLLAPAEVGTLLVKVPLPAEIPPGDYHGALLLQGFLEGSIGVSISVIGEEGTAAEDGDEHVVEPEEPDRAAAKDEDQEGTPAAAEEPDDGAAAEAPNPKLKAKTSRQRKKSKRKSAPEEPKT